MEDDPFFVCVKNQNDNLKKQWKKTSKKIKMEDHPFFVCVKNQNDELKKQWKKTLKKKMEDDLKGKKWKTTSKNNGRRPQKKMKDEPINQN